MKILHVVRTVDVSFFCALNWMLVTGTSSSTSSLTRVLTSSPDLDSYNLSTPSVYPARISLLFGVYLQHRTSFSYPLKKDKHGLEHHKSHCLKRAQMSAGTRQKHCSLSSKKVNQNLNNRCFLSFTKM